MKEHVLGFINRHPRLANWVFLAVGMVVLFLWAARGQALTLGQLSGLLVACVMLAGACAWIIGWE